MSRINIRFKDLQNTAMSCKDKSKGHMLNANFRLHYNELTNTIDLIERYGDNVLAQTNTDNETTFTALEDILYQSETSKILSLYGVYIATIQGRKGIKAHQSREITEAYDHTNKPIAPQRTFIYIPGGITIDQYGIVIKANDYRESVIDKVWNNKYTQTSKKQRAKLHALDIMIPHDTKDKASRQQSITGIETKRLLDLILYTEKPTGKHLLQIRKLLGYPKGNLRKLLQSVLNEYREHMATEANKLTIKTYENIPY